MVKKTMSLTPASVTGACFRNQRFPIEIGIKNNRDGTLNLVILMRFLKKSRNL
ncbi:MAG: hypothetical protein AB1638_11415 [Nitrospirota bacterium]